MKTKHKKEAIYTIWKNFSVKSYKVINQVKKEIWIMFFFSSLASDCCSEGELLRGFNSLEWLGVGICSLLTI